MRKMSASTFKAQCLRVMEQVKTNREEVLITKKGRPIARLVPADEPPADIFGGLAGVLEIVGDVEEPAAALSDWEQAR